MSDEEDMLAQCLFLVVHDEEIPDCWTEYFSETELYFLLPLCLNNEDEICRIFSRKGVRILRSAEECPPTLIEAVKDKRVEIVEMFLRNDFNDRDTEDILLTIHVENWKVPIAEALFSRNNNVTLWHDTDSERPLDSSALNEVNLGIIEHLLNFSSDIYYREEYECLSLLYLAVIRNSKPLVTLLLKNGVNIDIEISGTPLYVAASNGLEVMVEYLLQEGANVNGVEDSIPLCAALYQVQECIKTGEYIEEEKFKLPARCRIVDQLLEYGANVNSNCNYHGSVLHLAINTNPQILSCILRHHPDLNCKINREAFQKALSQNNKEIIDSLHDYGFVSSFDLDAFFQAISSKNVNIFQQLVIEGADVNHHCSSHASKFFGLKPLHVAAENFQEEIVQLLLDYEADVTATSIEGTPLFHAVKVLDLNAVKFLLAKGASIQENPLILHSAVEAKPPVLSIDQKNSSVSLREARDTRVVNKGKTSSAVIQMVELLMKHGAHFDPENDNLRTSLMGHVHLGNLEVIEFLLKHKFEESDVIEAMVRAILADSQNTTKFFLNYSGHLLPETFVGRSLLEQLLKQWMGCPSVLSILLNYNYLKLKLIADSGILDFISRRECQVQAANFEFDLGLDEGNYFNSYGCTQDVITKHIIKVKAANLRINHMDSTTSLLSYERGMNKFKSECATELKRLKSQSIGNSAVTFYNILDATAAEIAIYLKNKSVVNVLKSCDYKKKFPLYGDIIDSIFQKVFYRKSLMKQCALTFSFLSEKSSELPNDIRERILKHLSNPHLLIFSNVFRLQRSMYSFLS